MSGYRKILIISSEFPPGPGGIGNHAYNLAKFLNLNNIECKVLTVSDFAEKTDTVEFDRLQNFEIVRFERFDSRIKTFRGRIKKIRKAISEEKFTDVIFSGRFSLVSSLFTDARRSETKFIAIVHGGDVNSENGLIRAVVNRALKKMDLIIPVSKFSRSKISAQLESAKVVVIPNGFNFENIAAANVPDKALLNDKLNLVTVGTVWPRKGHHNVLRVLPSLISSHPEIEYGIIGHLADTSKVKPYFDDNNLKKHLRIYGAISNEEMIRILKASHIFIMLSETQSSGDFEGFGIAVIEANFFGLPAIGSKKSGLEDSIKDGVTGVLVDPKNDNEISDAVQKILGDYKTFSLNARAWAEKHHWSEIVKKYINAIDNIH